MERQQVERIFDVVVGDATNGGAGNDGRVAKINEENRAVVGRGGGGFREVVWREEVGREKEGSKRRKNRRAIMSNDVSKKKGNRRNIRRQMTDQTRGRKGEEESKDKMDTFLKFIPKESTE